MAKATRRYGMRLLATLLATAGCEEVEQMTDRFRDLTPHESYLQTIASAGLLTTAIGRDWTRVAHDAVVSPPTVPLPFREEGYIPPEEPTALGYRLSLVRGQVLTVRLDVDAADSLRVFVDLFRVPEDSRDPLRPVISSDRPSQDLVFEPNRGGDYVLRLQPELLRGGRYRVTLSLDLAFSFPVEGLDHNAVMSVFGDSREGGRRRHRGVDILAQRGTPALAASDAVVSRVQNTAVGGRVVWLSDERRNARIYYAHLDRQYVRPGQHVSAGDTVGFVGNTGNARTTPPHLHFGIYARRATDPMPWIRLPRQSLPRETARLTAVGSWMRVREGETAEVRSSPSGAADLETEVGRHTPFRVMAGAGSWYRVQLPDGSGGYLRASVAEPLTHLAELVVEVSASVQAGPSMSAPVLGGVEAGTALPVLGTFGGYDYVVAPDGRRGWISQGYGPSALVRAGGRRVTQDG